jgi:Domain of unknown function (DUF4062)
VARIYISATYGDLKEHREKANRALRQLGHDAIASSPTCPSSRSLMLTASAMATPPD